MKRLSDYYPWFSQNKIPLPQPHQEIKLGRFLDLLLSWNEKMSLTADTAPHILLTRHLLDSLTPLAIRKIDGIPILDVGSGTGFPAVPLAVMLPESNFILIEKVARKCAFLRMVVRRLELKNIMISECRLRDWRLGEEFPRTAITRAVRVDGQLKRELSEKGVCRLLYFSSQGSEKSVFEYRLPGENRNRYLEDIPV